jgi:hypothetical protein
MDQHMFTPKGDRAEWRILYDALRKLTPGEVISYQQLSDLLSGIPEVLRVTGRQPGAGPGRGGIEHLVW